MLRNVIAVLAIVLVLGSSGRSTSAFARGGGDGFHRNHFGGGFGDTPGDSRGGYGNCASGLRGGFRGYWSRDVWATGAAIMGLIPPI